MNTQKINIVADAMALSAEFTRLKIDRARWGIEADAQTNAARIGFENYLIGVAGGITRLEIENAELLAVLQELQESASYWGEYDVPVGIVDRINAAIAKATRSAS